MFPSKNSDDVIHPLQHPNPDQANSPPSSTYSPSFTITPLTGSTLPASSTQSPAVTLSTVPLAVQQSANISQPSSFHQLHPTHSHLTSTLPTESLDTSQIPTAFLKRPASQLQGSPQKLRRLHDLSAANIDHQQIPTQQIPAQRHLSAVLTVPNDESNHETPNPSQPVPVESSSPPPILHGSQPPKHSCQQCGKAFKRAHNLKIHARVHTGERPYNCPFQHCQKDFKWKSSYVSHISWHTDKKGHTLPPSTSVTHSAHPHLSTNHVTPSPLLSGPQPQETDASNQGLENPQDPTGQQGHKQAFQQSSQDQQPLDQPIPYPQHTVQQERKLTQQTQMIQLPHPLHPTKLQSLENSIPNSIPGRTDSQRQNHLWPSLQVHTHQPKSHTSQENRYLHPQIQQIQEGQPRHYTETDHHTSSKTRKRPFSQQLVPFKPQEDPSTFAIQHTQPQKRPRQHTFCINQHIEQMSLPSTAQYNRKTPTMNPNQAPCNASQMLGQNYPVTVEEGTSIRWPTTVQAPSAPTIDTGIQGQRERVHTQVPPNLQTQSLKNFAPDKWKSGTTNNRDSIQPSTRTSHLVPNCPSSSRTIPTTPRAPTQIRSAIDSSVIGAIPRAVCARAATVEQPERSENDITALEAIVEHSFATARGRNIIAKLYRESDQLASMLDSTGGLCGETI